MENRDDAYNDYIKAYTDRQHRVSVDRNDSDSWLTVYEPKPEAWRYIEAYDTRNGVWWHLMGECETSKQWTLVKHANDGVYCLGDYDGKTRHAAHVRWMRADKVDQYRRIRHYVDSMQTFVNQWQLDRIADMMPDTGTLRAALEITRRIMYTESEDEAMACYSTALELDAISMQGTPAWERRQHYYSVIHRLHVAWLWRKREAASVWQRFNRYIQEEQ